MPNCIAEILAPEQRRQEIAAILGQGLHRYCMACKAAPGPCDSAPDFSDQKALDVSAPGDPHVSWLAKPRT